MAGVLAGGQIAGGGPATAACEALLEMELAPARVLLTTSCTHALEMAAILLDVGPGDEVVVPSFTFTSTANAFASRGASVVLVDIRPDTLNLDEDQLAELITERTKAVVPVHYAGVAAEMDTISRICASSRVTVVEDNAHGLFGRYRGRPLGTLGRLATQSFHETKNLSCGEGGALVINDESLVDRAEIVREKGTDRSRFHRGQVDKYTWVDFGSSYVISDLLAAALAVQLDRAGEIQAKRAGIFHRYQTGLSDWAEASGVRMPFVPPHCEQAFHMFYLILPDLASRSRLIAHLRENGVLAVFHYLPLHRSPLAVRLGFDRVDCPVTESVADRLVRLPFYTDLSPTDQDQVIALVRDFRC